MRNIVNWAQIDEAGCWGEVLAGKTEGGGSILRHSYWCLGCFELPQRFDTGHYCSDQADYFFHLHWFHWGDGSGVGGTQLEVPSGIVNGGCLWVEQVDLPPYGQAAVLIFLNHWEDDIKIRAIQEEVRAKFLEFFEVTPGGSIFRLLALLWKGNKKDEAGALQQIFSQNKRRGGKS